MDIKCVIVGDSSVGKTALWKSFVCKTFAKDCPITVYDDTTIRITVDEMNVKLELLDISGNEAYEQLRPTAYRGADVFLLCFALNNKMNLYNSKAMWHPELSQYNPNVPIVLVGTKLDTRKNKESNTDAKAIISKVEGERIAKKIKAFKYLECSSLTQEGLKEVFDEVVRATLKKKSSGSHKKCIIL